MTEQGDRARKALHDLRWGPHIDDIVERHEAMEDAIKVALDAVSFLEAYIEECEKRARPMSMDEMKETCVYVWG